MAAGAWMPLPPSCRVTIACLDIINSHLHLHNGKQ
jgi:hypothetical protein